MARGLLYAGVVALACLPVSAADDPTGNWPQWRGPKRDDVSTDTGLLTKWDGAPKLLWETKGAGRGYASVAVVGGKVYTMGDNLSTAQDKDEYATCFDAATGKQLWMTKLGPAVRTGGYDGSHATPNVDGEHVYFMTPQAVIVCLKAADGKEVWRKDLQKDFQGKKGDGWGYSESVLIDGDNLICTPGNAANTMVALNKKTGEKVWAAPVAGDKGAGHSSVMVSEIGGTRVYVQTTASFVLGVRAKDGKVLWTHPIGATAVIPTPIVKGDLVLAVAGYGKGAALLRQVPGPDGDVKVEVVYDYKREMTNKHGGVVLLGDYVYGDADDRGSIWCAKLTTGEQQPGWRVPPPATQRGGNSASVTAADGHLYVRYADGKMALAKADPAAGYKEVGSFQIPHKGSAPSWSHPVVTGGRLYLRENDWIMCYDVKAK